MSFAPSVTSSTSRSLPLHAAVYVRRGREDVLRSEGLLSRFADLCEQPGTMSDMAYFLAKPGILKRTPVLLLIAREGGLCDAELEAPYLLGALMLYEYHLSGFKTQFYTSNDRSGRNTLLAPPALRTETALFAARWLQDQGAQITLLSFRETPTSAEGTFSQPMPASHSSVWAMRQREIPEFLPLAPTYDETLAAIGQRTRSNLRYYRRRTERELGCSFLPRLEISREDLLLFNRQCMFASPDAVVSWRFETMNSLQDPVLMGLRDRDGRLLSVIGGRRVGRSSEVLWQMNRNGLRHLSLSLVMRSYFLEHEIDRGSNRFYIEGGTGHPIRESFTKATVTDLGVLRKSPTTALLRKLARYTAQEDNDLAGILFDPEVEWKTTPPAPDRLRRSLLNISTVLHL